MVAQFQPKLAKKSWSGMSPDDVPAGKALMAADIGTRAAAFGAVLDRLKDWYQEYTASEARWKQRKTAGRQAAMDALYDHRCLLICTLIGLRRPRLTLSDRLAAKLVGLYLREEGGFRPYAWYIEGVWDVIRPHAAAHGVGPHLRKALDRLIRKLRRTGFVNELKFADKFEGLLATRR
jgi:hypothetical protein